jgi:hypothetical protein
LTTAVQQKVDLQIHNYASQTDLVNAANQATIYGGFVPQTNTVIINEAASLWAPGIMPAYYEEAAKAQGETLNFQVVNQLPTMDPEGVVPGLVTFVLLVAGYLGSTLAMQRTGVAAARRQVQSLLLYAIVAALVFDLIVGPGLGAYPDIAKNFWPLWGEFALMCAAVALLAAALQTLIGPIGTLLTVILVVFIGNPSTGGVNGTAFLPAGWQFIGPILPAWNGTILIRNTLYFHGNSILQQLLVLSLYVVVFGALVIFFSWGHLLWWRGNNVISRSDEVITRDDEIGVAAIPPG